MCPAVYVEHTLQGTTLYSQPHTHTPFNTWSGSTEIQLVSCVDQTVGHYVLNRPAGATCVHIHPHSTAVSS